MLFYIDKAPESKRTNFFKFKDNFFKEEQLDLLNRDICFRINYSENYNLFSSHEHNLVHYFLKHRYGESLLFCQLIDLPVLQDLNYIVNLTLLIKSFYINFIKNKGLYTKTRNEDLTKKLNDINYESRRKRNLLEFFRVNLDLFKEILDEEDKEKLIDFVNKYGLMEDVYNWGIETYLNEITNKKIIGKTYDKLLIYQDNKTIHDCMFKLTNQGNDLNLKDF